MYSYPSFDRTKGTQVGSVFVALDSVKEDDGLRFVKGSQKWDLHNPQHFADGSPYVGTRLPPLPDVDDMVKKGEVTLLKVG